MKDTGKDAHPFVGLLLVCLNPLGFSLCPKEKGTIRVYSSFSLVRPEQVPVTVASLPSVNEVKLVMETGEGQYVLVLGIFLDRAARSRSLDTAIRGRPGVHWAT